MCKLLIRSAFLAALNVATAIGLIWTVDNLRAPEPWETRSPLRSMHSDRQSSFVLVGSSHVQVFLMCESSTALVRDAFGQDVGVISKAGSGVFQHNLFLREYFRRGNTADTVLYFADPWSFYSEHWNEAMELNLNEEPLDWSFTLDMVRSGTHMKSVFGYLRSKLRYTAFLKEESGDWDCDRQLKTYHQGIARLRLKNLYPDGMDQATLEHYLDQLESLINACQARNSEVIIVVPPTLLGTEPGFDAVWKSFKQLEKKYGIRAIDCSQSMENVPWYFDHDHLNNEGIHHFLNNVLLPQIAANDEA